MKVKDHLGISDFEGLVNETFVFSAEGVDQKLEGQLVSVDKLKPTGAPGANSEPFRIQFKLPPRSNIGQCMLRIENPVFGAAEMFLVPVSEDDAGWYMDATFN